MAKRKAVKTYEHEKETSAFIQPEQARQENLEQDVAVDGADIEGGQSISQAILGLGQAYGNRYVRSLIGDRGKVDGQTQGRIEAQRGSGRPLDAGLLSDVESSYNRDLGDVRLHTGSDASALAQELNAQAFTTGKDIFFADNAFRPDTGQGMKILRHELAHVAQQVEDMDALPSVLTQPGDMVEIDAREAENTDSWSPAAALPAGAIARGNPVSTPEAVTSAPVSANAPATPASSNAPATPSAAQGAPDADAARARAFRALWFSSVVTPLNNSQGLLMSGQVDSAKATQVMSLLDSCMTAIQSVAPSYADRPDILTGMQRDHNTVLAVKAGLTAYAGIPMSMDSIITNLTLASGRLAATGDSL